MSSDNKKIFTTQATSKGAGATVTSDVLAMPDNTHGHVLNVKADASCSGVVDVELEMSPDGTNWCPAVTRTVTATTTARDPQIGNEEYVKLTPDAGEFKNKHARGGLNFDVNGAVVTPDGSGARDLMHQHISVDKSFNYSQWFKTSEAPTTTYKPVLFRHGGYDDFENLKVVQTDSNTTTQNLSKLNSEDKAIELTGYSTTNNGNDAITGEGFDLTASQGSHINPFKVNSNLHNVSDTEYYTDTTYLPNIFLNTHNNSGMVVSCQIKLPSSNVSQDIATITLANGNYIQFRATFFTGNLTLRTIYGYNNGANEVYLEKNTGTATANTWYHVAWRAMLNPSGASNQYYTVFVRDGTHLTAGGGNFTISTSSVNNTTHSSSAVSSVEICNKRTGYNGLSTPVVVDNLAFWQGSPYDGSSNRWDLMYANRNNPAADPTIGGCKLTALFKMGDGPDDTLSPVVIKDVVEPTSYRQMTPVTNSTGNSIVTLTSSDDPYVIEMEQFPAIFDTSATSSISGWFKTTDTGTLFSNTGGAAATGLKVDVSGSAITASYLSSSLSTSVSGTFNDGNWHHIVMTLSSGSQLIVVDNISSGTSNHTLVNDDLRGDNGFTLLGDGQENAGNTSAASTDASKLAASLSNWSFHTETISTEGIAQLYSNGHVRNIKNLPSVSASNILHWWKVSSTTNPEEDSGGAVALTYQDGASAALTTKVVDATGPVLVEDTINGNAMTLSLTKSFNFTTKEWVSTADQDTALCLSFNGFEEQAEHVALWKCSQTIAGSTIDICDGGWHNVILSYRGNNDLAGNNVAEGDTVKFGPGPAQSLPFNWCMSFDGQPLTAIKDGSGADYIDGLGTIVTDTYNSVSYNVGFAIHNRHMRYETSNTEEVYKPHAQFSAGIHEVTGVDNNTAFQGSVDETSFHSDCWWVDQAGTSVITNTFNQEKPATIYGSTTALTDRGTGTKYPEGVPYPLTSPDEIGSARGGNQWINPYRKGEIQEDTNVSIGGVEGWWRWGDTPGDCSVTINDVKDHNDSINARDIDAFGIVTADRVDMSTASESIYNENITGSSVTGSLTVTFPQVVVSGIQASICNIKQMVSPVLKYLRVKFTGAGSCDLGANSVQAQINFRVKE